MLNVPIGNAAAAAQESGGQLRLNPALASVSADAAGSPGRSLLLHLLTDTQTANLGLGQATSFAAALELYFNKLRSDTMRTIDEYVGALVEWISRAIPLAAHLVGFGRIGTHEPSARQRIVDQP